MSGGLKEKNGCFIRWQQSGDDSAKLELLINLLWRYKDNTNTFINNAAEISSFLVILNEKGTAQYKP